MRRIIVPFVVILAIVLGALLPTGYLTIQDRHLAVPMSYRVEEPVLRHSEASSVAASVFNVVDSSDALAWRLYSFQTSVPLTIPLRSNQADIWAEQAVEFLAAALEVPVEIISVAAEYQLALFEDGTAVPYWFIYCEFNDQWQCSMAIDDISGAILCLELHSGSTDLAELFPDSFEAGSGSPQTSFETLATRHFTDALGDFMAVGVYVRPGEDPSTVTLSFHDTPDFQLALRFTLDLVEGIIFNSPVPF